jgi:hypothetical protein
MQPRAACSAELLAWSHPAVPARAGSSGTWTADGYGRCDLGGG